MGLADLCAAYRLFDDPRVAPAAVGETFSAWEYARQRCEALWGEGAPAGSPQADREGNV
jgi:hypothetical protein